MPYAVARLALLLALIPVLGSASLATAAPESATLPVVRCATTYGVSQSNAPRVPSRLSADITAPLVQRLAFYSNGWISLLAPRGWHCSGAVGADGTLSLDVLPAYVSGVTSTAAAVTALIPSACIGCIGEMACPFFPEASRMSPYAQCGHIPTRERVYRLSAHAITFDDPPGVTGTGHPSGGPYPASGVVMFNGVTTASRSVYPRAAQETCTLPEAQHALCTAAMNDYLRRYRL